MSWEEYEVLGADARAEYVDEALVVSLSPTGRHQDIARRLADLMETVLPETAWVREEWAWNPGVDELTPDVMVFDDTDEDVRWTGTPYVAVEVLSTDRAADIIRKAATHAEAGLPRYRIIDPDRPEIIVFELHDGILFETGRRGPGHVVELDLGPATVRLDPATLIHTRSGSPSGR